jgi:hypothetical protein
MALPITIPYTFANATSSIPLSNLDTDFTTVANAINGIGNGTVGLTTITSPAATALTIQSAGTTAMTVDTSQRVGIGTVSPARLLDLEQASTDYQIRVGDTTNYYDIGRNTGNGLFTFYGSQAAASGYVFSTVNGERMRIDTSGNLLVGYTSSNGAYKLQVNSQIFATSSTIATSDARYKQNVQTLNGALSIVKALRPVSFDWKKHPVHAFDTENTTVGFLAQEVQQVLADKSYLNSIIKKNECVIEPEVKDENGNVITETVTEEFLGIAEGNMIAILTSAIQELSAKNDALEARLAALEVK